MKTGQDGIDLIKSFEGFRNKAYLDSIGVPTIGYGTTWYPDGTKVKLGDKCTEEQAEEYLKYALGKFEAAINKDIKVTISQKMFDALACFVYNVGIGNFESSTLLKKINAKDFLGASDQFIRWNKAGGKVLDGLTRRREAEAALFKSGNIDSVPF